jgi:AraC-like DNA-binding protein
MNHPSQGKLVTDRVNMGVLRALAVEVSNVVDLDAIVRSENIDVTETYVGARALLRILDRIAYVSENRNALATRAEQERGSSHGFALRAGIRTGVGIFGAVEYASRSAQTFGEAFEIFATHFDSLSTLATARITSKDSEVHLQFPLTGDIDPSPWLPEYTASAVVHSIQSVVGSQWRPLRVGFRHAAPSGDRPTLTSRVRTARACALDYQRVFGCPIEFAAEVDCIVCAASDMARKLPTADSVVVTALTGVLTSTRLLRPLAACSISDIRVVIRQSLPQGRHAITAIANRWNVSSRTLQRRIAELGATLTDLMDQVRHEVACELVGQTRTPMIDVATQVGFSSAAAFSRAFYRWTSMQPRTYRHEYLLSQRLAG